MIENEVENCKQFIDVIKRKMPAILRAFWVAGMQGFEPRLMDPESTVLPLDDIPMNTEYTGFIKKINRILIL